MTVVWLSSSCEKFSFVRDDTEETGVSVVVNCGFGETIRGSVTLSSVDAGSRLVIQVGGCEEQAVITATDVTVGDVSEVETSPQLGVGWWFGLGRMLERFMMCDPVELKDLRLSDTAGRGFNPS